MVKQLSAPLLEGLELLLLVIGSSALSAVGLFIESRAVQALVAGDLEVGAWMLFMGAVALYFGVYLLGYGELLPRLRALASSGSGS